MTYKNTEEFALQLDSNDELSHYRNEFHIPLQKNGKEHIYLCGNSLGLQARRTSEFINQELEDWATFGVEGHFHAKNPWMPYHEFLTESYSKIVGAKPSEIVAMNTLTVNLHLMMVSFYRPTKNSIAKPSQKPKIIEPTVSNIIGDEFMGNLRRFLLRNERAMCSIISSLDEPNYY